ncbi:MAG TPA: hypothetical protein VHJ77_01005 [Vicinamibacterales bacterium]|nr:hypothetical protein [Vicinamibacterales bacterium]
MSRVLDCGAGAERGAPREANRITAANRCEQILFCARQWFAVRVVAVYEAPFGGLARGQAPRTGHSNGRRRRPVTELARERPGRAEQPRPPLFDGRHVDARRIDTRRLALDIGDLREDLALPVGKKARVRPVRQIDRTVSVAVDRPADADRRTLMHRAAQRILGALRCRAVRSNRHEVSGTGRRLCGWRVSEERNESYRNHQCSHAP